MQKKDTIILTNNLSLQSSGVARKDIDRCLDLLQNTKSPFDRNSFSPGHITASGVVLSPDDQHIILIFHKKLQLWLQPGGHVEAEDKDLVSAARREVNEETGLALANDFVSRLLSIDIHKIPANKTEPEHLHYDYKFSFKAQQVELADSQENLSVRWHSIEKLTIEKKPASVLRAVERYRELSLL